MGNLLVTDRWRQNQLTRDLCCGTGFNCEMDNQIFRPNWITEFPDIYDVKLIDNKPFYENSIVPKYIQPECAENVLLLYHGNKYILSKDQLEQYFEICIDGTLKQKNTVLCNHWLQCFRVKDGQVNKFITTIYTYHDSF